MTTRQINIPARRCGRTWDLEEWIKQFVCVNGHAMQVQPYQLQMLKHLDQKKGSQNEHREKTRTR